MKEGNTISSKQLTVGNEEALSVVHALSSRTSFAILRLVSEQPLDISTIARCLYLSEAHVSEKVKALENAGLVNIKYTPGKRGVRKICRLAFERILILIKPQGPAGTLLEDNDRSIG